MGVDLQKRHLYKISRSGVYLGLLPNVTSDFGYNQLINTAVVQMVVTVGLTPDTVSLPPSPILDELADPVLDENGGTVTEEQQPEIIGDASGTALIRSGNDIEVWEYSSYHPNGVLVYTGYISKWKATFGGSDDITITCLTNGQDLSNHLMPGGSATILDQSQSSLVNSFLYSMYEAGSASANPARWGQTFTVGGGVSNVSAVALTLACTDAASPKTVTVSLYRLFTDRANGIAPLATVSQSVNTTVATAYTFTFATAVTVSAATQYFIEVIGAPLNNASDYASIHVNDAGGYTGGGAYLQASGGAMHAITPNNLWFKTYYTTGSTSKTYTTSDVSTGILTDFINDYISGGGLVAKPPAGYTATGVLATYTFKVNTTLEGIQKVYELGPAGWFWYVDPATNILYYQAALTTAEHLMIRGRHFAELSIEATKEEIANVVYFSGGLNAAGTQNVFVKTTSPTSLLTNRAGLVRLSDNRVSGADGPSTATLLSQNYINQHSAETYITQVTVQDGTYDIGTFNLGQIVGFEGFGGFADRLLLQIVGINRGVDNVVLSLGVIPRRQSQQIEDIEGALVAAQTVANPSIPS